ncbi:YcjF family protein [Candidatus Colwellia aromaticivorans]|uniref:YcjF family protein n=1 Tax=Candidatus Colwellia aromaticivorans TaxID=2267621 RepID=UPI000DF3AE60|nr:TIGR01620 family protein [Candidatus Colwellia aromaticivorans]
MNKGNDKTDEKTHQQQILFSDSELLIEQVTNEVKASQDGKQVIFDNQDYLPIDEQKELPALLNEQTLEHNLTATKSKPRWLWRIALTLLTGVIGVETVDFFMMGFVNSPIITSVYGVILSCLIVLASSSVFSEWSTLRQFKCREKLKQQACELLSDNSLTKEQNISALDVKTFCQKVSENLPCDLVSEQEQAWQDALNAQYSDAELLQLYSRLVLTKVDEKAMAEIAKFSTEAVVLVALSPVALIDMLIILWRNLRMINKVALLYGIKLGYWSRIKLIRQVFVNMAYAGASELIADFGSDMIGADLLGKLSGRLAQGLGAGMLTARLGVKTMQLCRPIPFADKPKLAHVRREMLATIKNLISRKA